MKVQTRRGIIDLSHLTAEHALLLFELLSDIASTIWDAHEPEISQLVCTAEQARLRREELDEACHASALASIADDSFGDDELF